MRKNKTAQIVIVCLVLILDVMVLTVGLLFSVPFKTSIGEKQINNWCGKISEKNKGLLEDGFSATEWDGPTGTYSHGKVYSYKRGDWMWTINIYTGDPAAGF